MIVMELAKGGELSEYLQKTGKMPEEKAKGTLDHLWRPARRPGQMSVVVKCRSNELVYVHICL